VSDPGQLELLITQAQSAAAQNDYATAISFYRLALELAPLAVHLNFSLANAFLASGNLTEAAAGFRRALALEPSNYGAHLHLGVTLFHAGQTDTAVETLTLATTIGAEDIQAHITLAKIYKMQRRTADAEKYLRQALVVKPNATEAQLELGQLMFEAYSFREASTLLSQVVASTPDNVDAGLQFIAALLNLGDSENAFNEAVRIEKLQPGDLRIQRMKLTACKQRQDHPGVLACARTILAAAPEDAWTLREVLQAAADQPEGREAHQALTLICRETPKDIQNWKALAAAATTYEQLIEVLEEGIAWSDDPSLRLIRALTLPKVPDSNEQIVTVRHDMAQHLDRIIKGGSYRIANLLKSVNKTAYRLAYHGRDDRGLQEKIAAAHLAVAPELAWTSPLLARERRHRQKIRIGFISAFFEWHSVGRMLSGLIRDLDRTRFEVIVIRPDRTADAYGQAINNSADGVITYPPNLAAARAKIAEADLDILFYADIGMEPFTYYLAFSRLARRQIVWPGHPVTTGLGTFDGFISATSCEPEDCEKHYTEKLIRLSTVPIYDTRRVPAPDSDFRAALNLPAGTLYVCPMTLPKFHPDFDRLIARILKQDPRGNLVMVSPAGSESLHKRMSHSIPELAGRIFTLPWLNKHQFSGLLHAADANLDTIHFSGSGTSRDAAAVGAPIVTLEGRYMRGRLSAGMYLDMGLPHLVNRNEDDYVDLALRLANDRAYRASIGAEVREASAALIAPRKLLAEFEACFTDLLANA
jgi:protein O-GlcNAc transferase